MLVLGLIVFGAFFGKEYLLTFVVLPHFVCFLICNGTLVICMLSNIICTSLNTYFLN
jgi:hypothetical protein